MCLQFHISNKWVGQMEFLEEAVANRGFIGLKTGISVYHQWNLELFPPKAGFTNRIGESFFRRAFFLSFMNEGCGL